MEGMNLKVIYHYPGIVTELDDKIIAFFKELGFHFWASGYTLGESARDLAFEFKGTEENKE